MPDLFTHDDPTPQAAAHAGRFAVVAVEQGLDSGLTYAVPDELADVAVGERVHVPLGRGNRATPGYVVSLTDTIDFDPKKVKPILKRDPARVKLPADLMRLATWMAAYYCCPLGMVLVSLLPSAVKKQTGTQTRQQVRSAAAPPADAKATPLQRAVLDQADERWVDVRALADAAGARSVSPVKQLIAKGLLDARLQEVVVSDLDLRAQALKPKPPPTLTPQQIDALAAITPMLAPDAGFNVALLHGVTGSGKTEVYLRAIASLLHAESSAGAIVLVPEIALTPQTVARFIERFEGVAVLHSGLTAAQRNAQWRRIADGHARLVVGARSALFAPLPNLRLIVVDEEHDTSYKQDQLPRYHARDCAIKRAQLAGATVVLGSATPALESYYNSDALAEGLGVSRYVPMPDRVTGFNLPRVDTVDLREANRDRRGVHLLTPPLEQAIDDTTQAGGQCIVLLNRRGYANYIACPDQGCGWTATCNHCDAAMVYHKHRELPAGGLVRCHHCDAEQKLPDTCPQCKRTRVTTFGLGTQRVEEELARKLPHLKLLRMDSDTMRSANHYRETLEAFRIGDAHVLLGTQMIAKGLDFANVRLVGVVSADTSLHLPDFRAAERTFQLIAQVSGRAGRGEHAGRVILQSLNPNDPTIQLAAQHDYATFAQRELQFRREVGLPPVTRMTRIVVRDPDQPAALQRAHDLYQTLKHANDTLGLGVRLRPPAPCPIARIADHHRYQLELIAPTAGVMQQLLTQLRNAKRLLSDHQTAIDIDPTSLL